MLLPKFEFHEPSTLGEACQLMGELGQKAKLLAGGTDLLVNMKKKLIVPDHVVSLGRIKELRNMAPFDAGIRIGALVSAADLAESQEVGKILSAVGTGAAVLGSPLIRNLATLGGNLVTARPAADLPPALIAYGAKAILKKSGRERSVPLDAFFLGPGQTVIEQGEILSEVQIKNPLPNSGAAYIKLGMRRALEISLVNVAAFISLDANGGAIESARVVLGAVAPTPIRATSAEKVLLGERPGDALFARAGEAAAQDSKPISDYRGSAEYRRDMVKILTKRALSKALTDMKRA